MGASSSILQSLYSMEIIYLLGSVQAFFLDLLLANKKDKSKADLLLMAWLFLIGLHILFFYIKATHGNLPFFLIIVNACFPLLQGPFLYFYTTYFTQSDSEGTTLFWPHLLPFCSFMLLGFFLPEHLWVSLLITAVILSGLTYIYYTLKNVNAFQKKEAFRKLLNIKWLKKLTFSLGALWCAMLCILFLAHFSTTIIRLSHQMLFVLVSCFVFIVGFLGIKQGTIFVNLPEEKKVLKQANKKYAQSGLKERDMEVLEKQLLAYMETKQPFTQSDFSIKIMATQLETPPYHISQLLSSRLQTKFYDFVNIYRVEKAKSLMHDPKFQHLSLLGLAYDCGFNSKSTFNRAFKKQVGCTPSQYKKQSNFSAKD